jgi:hypothetical protein
MSVEAGRVQKAAWRIYFKVAPHLPSATPATPIDRALNRVLGTGNVLDREDALVLHAAVLKISDKRSPISVMAGGPALDADIVPFAPQHLIDPGKSLPLGYVPRRATRWEETAGGGMLSVDRTGGGLDRFPTPVLSVARSWRWGGSLPADQIPIQLHDGRMAAGKSIYFVDNAGGMGAGRFRITPRQLGNRIAAGGRFKISPRELGNKTAVQEQRREWLSLGAWYLDGVVRAPINLVGCLVNDMRNLWRRLWP